MNQFTTKQSDTLQESYTRIDHQSGLTIFVFPKDFSTTYALFGTKYGSIDNCFRTVDTNEEICVPDGIAHFLEHKMFENPNGEDTFVRFARYGASANAYTSFDKTCYLFSSTDSFYESLEILLDYVTHPYFTPQTVDKEQGIIGQEIQMGLDDPGNRLIFGTLDCLYETHPVKLDIAGSVASIAKITADLLYQCYHAFYNLNNMVLCICGNADPQKVAAIADRFLQKAPPMTVQRNFPKESPCVAKKRFHSNMSVAAPLFDICVKDVDISSDPTERAKKRAALSILCDMLFGKQSAFFTNLYENGLLNGTLDYWYEHNESFSMISVSGESRDPEKVWNEFLQYIDHMKNVGLDKICFERYKKVQYAQLLDIFDSTDSVANHFIGEYFDGADLLDAPQLLNELCYQDITDLFYRIFQEESYAMGIIDPLDESKEQA